MKTGRYNTILKQVKYLFIFQDWKKWATKANIKMIISLVIYCLRPAKEKDEKHNSSSLQKNSEYPQSHLKQKKAKQKPLFRREKVNAIYSDGTCYILLMTSTILFKACLKFLSEIYLQCFLAFVQNFKADPLLGGITL